MRIVLLWATRKSPIFAVLFAYRATGLIVMVIFSARITFIIYVQLSSPFLPAYLNISK